MCTCEAVDLMCMQIEMLDSPICLGSLTLSAKDPAFTLVCGLSPKALGLWLRADGQSHTPAVWRDPKPTLEIGRSAVVGSV